jgi:hypothetical protein
VAFPYTFPFILGPIVPTPDYRTAVITARDIVTIPVADRTAVILAADRLLMV